MSRKQTALRFIYQIFLKGLLAILPVTITIYLVVWITRKTEAIFAEPLREVFSDSLYFPGVGIIISLLVIFVVGLLVNNYLTARFFAWTESKLLKIPFFKVIYSPLRDVMNLFASDEKHVLKRVVLVEIQSTGVQLLGLVTRDQFSDLPGSGLPADTVAVFVPYSYAVGGFTILVSKSQIREIDIPVERAMQLAVTAWIKR
jgi:uncharacterized membrane protein